MTKTNLIKVLRWMAVPFTAAIGGYVAYFITMLYVGVNSIGYAIYTGDTPDAPISITKIILELVAQGVMGYVAVLVGSYTAPSYRFATSIALATFITTACAAIYIFAATYGQITLWQTICTLVTIIGAIAGVINVKGENEDALATA